MKRTADADFTEEPIPYTLVEPVAQTLKRVSICWCQPVWRNNLFVCLECGSLYLDRVQLEEWLEESA